VLTDIFSYAGKFVYLQIATSPAQQILPNGENAHCTLKTHDEWVERIKPLCGGSIVVKVVTWGQSEGETNLGQIEQKPSPLVKTATVVANGPSAYNADLWLEGDVVTINDTIQLLDSSVKPAFCFFTHGYVLGEFKDRWADVQTFVSPTQPFGDLPHGFPIQKWNHIPDYACGGSVGRLREQITTGGIAWSHTTTGAVHYLAKHGYQKIRIIGHDNGVEYFDTARRFGEMRNYSEWRDVTERLCGLLTEYYGCEIEWYERQPDDLW
jgi:hypothetical protein